MQTIHSHANNSSAGSNTTSYENSTNSIKGRCRPPSPESFQEIDLYNFSSDTLFGTHTLEDHSRLDPSNF